MRVTGGAARGRALTVPSGTRPMTARMREALFAILDNAFGRVPGEVYGGLQGRSFLDLFAGSGLSSAEAASRGAGPITAVERDPRKRRSILSNLTIVGAEATVIITPVERFVASAGRKGQNFGVVCMDPPYAYRHRLCLLYSLAAADILEPNGCVILHCHDSDQMESDALPYELIDRRRYGQSALLLFRA